MKIWIRNLDRPISKLKFWKKQLGLKAFQILCSRTSAYLDKCASVGSKIVKRYVPPYRNGRSIVWHIGILIFITLKRAKARSNRSEVFCKKSVLRNFAKFTKKTCTRISFLKKLRAPGLQLYLKRDSGTGVFLWILRNFYEHLFLQNTSGGCFFKAAKRILKTNVNNGKYDAMENKNKTVNHTPLTQGWSIYPLIEIWFCKKSQMPKVWKLNINKKESN